MIPVSQWNQFGGSLGGAILKNKLFYFGDYQATRRNSGGSTLIRVPSAAERTGDLSGLNRAIFDPTSGATPAARTQFLGNIIPASRLSPQSLNLLKLIPAANVPGAILDQPNWAGSGTLRDNQDQGNVRVDYFATDKLHIFGRYSIANIRLLSPGSFGLLAGGTGFDATGSSTLAYAGNSSQNNHSVALGADYAVSPSLFTDFRVGWLRWRVLNLPNGYGETPALDAGIVGLNNDKTLTSGMPAMNINDYANGLFKFGYGLTVSNCNCPLDQDEKQIQFVNNWTKVSGNHTIKFGGDIRRAYNLRVASDRHRSGELQFNAARTQGGAGGGSGLATFMLGDVTQMQRYISASTNARETQNRWFFFAQDSWKVSRKLTFNYGLRWEIYRPQKVNAPGNGGNLMLDTGEVQSYGIGNFGLDGNVKDRFTLLAPRVGVAYQMNSKTVVRAGYGRGFSMGAFGTVFGHNVTQEPAGSGQPDACRGE